MEDSTNSLNNQNDELGSSKDISQDDKIKQEIEINSKNIEQNNEDKEQKFVSKDNSSEMWEGIQPNRLIDI